MYVYVCMCMCMYVYVGREGGDPGRGEVNERCGEEGNKVQWRERGDVEGYKEEAHMMQGCQFVGFARCPHPSANNRSI